MHARALLIGQMSRLSGRRLFHRPFPVTPVRELGAEPLAPQHLLSALPAPSHGGYFVLRYHALNVPSFPKAAR